MQTRRVVVALILVGLVTIGAAAIAFAALRPGSSPPDRAAFLRELEPKGNGLVYADQDWAKQHTSEVLAIGQLSCGWLAARPERKVGLNELENDFLTDEPTINAIDRIAGRSFRNGAQITLAGYAWRHLCPSAYDQRAELPAGDD